MALVPDYGKRNQSKRSRGINKVRSSKFCVGSQVRQETPEEDQRTHRSKRCEYNNKDEDNSRKILNDKNKISFIKTINFNFKNPQYQLSGSGIFDFPSRTITSVETMHKILHQIT